jgi:putative acetyltransferase
MTITITEENPLQDEVRSLISELNETLHALTPPEHCYHMTADEMARADTTVFVARENGEAIACGALRLHEGVIGEVKRMYTRPKWRGQKIGGLILELIEALARNEKLHQLVLETGDRHPATWRVYERGGFARCGAVLDYPDSGFSLFYAKQLTTIPHEVGA